MTLSMGAAALLILAVLLVFVGLPGWIVYRLWLRRVSLSWRVGIVVVLAVQSVLFSNLGALFGYSLRLMLAVLLITVVSLSAIWITRRRVQREPEGVDGGAGRLPAILAQVLVFGVYFVPVFILYLPLDTDAQGFGYLALLVREGGTIHTLAPWHPEVRYLYSPSLFIWWAYLSDLLGLPLHQVMLPFSHIVAGMTALLGIDLAGVLLPDRPRARWLFPLTMVAGMSLYLTVMDSAYTSVFGFLFVALFLTLAFGSLRIDSRWLMALASIALAAVALTHPDTIIILLIAYIPFYALFWLSRGEHRNRRVWLRLFVLIPALGVALTIPWLARVWPLFFEAGVVSPFQLSMTHLRQLILFQGVIVAILAAVGLLLALRRRTLPDVLMATWVVALLDFSLFGVVDSAIDLTGIDVMRYVYPFSVAWHGPILVYPYLATLAADTLIERMPYRLTPRIRIVLPALGLVGLALIVLFQRPLVALSRSYVPFFGTFSSRADLAAMDYLRENAPPDALILNYPAGFEGHWVPVIAEREATAFRDQPFFAGAQPLYDRNAAFREAYFDPANPGTEALIREYGVDYVVFPQIVMDPESFDDPSRMMRWRWPEETWYALQSSPAEAGWLTLVFEQDGAQVWRVLP